MTELNQYPPKALANLLIQDGLIDLAVAKKATIEAHRSGVSFLNYLVSKQFILSDDVLKSCVKYFGLQTFNLDHYNYDWLTAIDMKFIFHYRIIPLYKKNNTLYIGISDPTEQEALDIIKLNTGLRTLPVLVAEDKLNQLIMLLQQNNDHTHSTEMSLFNDILPDEKTIHTIHEHALNEDEPLIKFVEQMIQNAFKQSASDIHIEPYEKYCRIRYRLDGVLYKIHEIPTHLASRLSARLKIMSQLDIAERRLPQDGRLKWRHIDIRINTCPTLHGEKIVLRLLDASKILRDFTHLGFTEEQRILFQNKISAPQGLILVTGPTGSGKTATLYSALNYLNTAEKNISTIENPVEIQLPGINQVNINPKIHLDFSTILRTLLRQDPDILMIGEIRDKETADTAIQAAETGHLVLSTLHTNSALETIHRFKSMNISAYHFMNALTLIIAQRLIRVLCQHCKQPEPALQSIAGISTDKQFYPVFNAKGCQFCINGYRDRTGIYEFFLMNKKISELILSGANHSLIEQEALRSGYIPLRTAAIEKIKNGITSLAEIQRVLQ